jgi:hypothetical protein
MSFKEFGNMSMWKQHLTISKLVLSLVRDKNRNEIHKLDNGLLIHIDLTVLDLDQLVAHILLNMQHDFTLQHMLDHLVILGN